MRLAILVWLLLISGPLLLDSLELRNSFALIEFSANVLVPAAGLQLGAMLLCRKRPGLGAVAFVGALLCLGMVLTVRDAQHGVDLSGWGPVVWGGLLTLAQLAIVVAAGHAWILAPSADGPLPHMGALVGAIAPFLMWAVLIPSHGWGRRPRLSANESRAIGDIRTMISAQALYQGANGGFYDVPECLSAPGRCIPGYGADAPTFVEPRLGLTTVVHEGYRRVFQPGPAADATAIHKARASSSSLVSFVYLAVPLQFGHTGVHALCGDASGRICFTTDGRAPGIENGQCAASCPTFF